jgi:hypothetical protein
MIFDVRGEKQDFFRNLQDISEIFYVYERIFESTNVKSCFSRSGLGAPVWS